ncbi:MAG: four helix bundle protein [Deltaproteobacteria bacterium]|nr:four helix bundle protein [Deltaproteobacteria bacterium]
MSVTSYQDLKVWQLSMELAEECYHITRGFPKEEMFGMTSQIRRSSAAIPANIAEGWGRSGTKEYIQFLRIAQGSLKELETHLILSQRVGLLEKEKSNRLLAKCNDLGKMIRSLIGSLQPRVK